MAQTEASSLFSSYLDQYRFYGDKHPRGTLVIIGGAENKTDKPDILRFIRRKVHDGKLVVCTASSSVPYEQWSVYERCFRRLGVRELVHLPLRDRQDAVHKDAEQILDGAAGVFLGGGGQDEGWEKLAGTPVVRKVREIYVQGGVVAGTSAGASLIGEFMPRGDDVIDGLGLLKRVIVDQHYTQRGRHQRLAEAVADNSRLLAIGIPENTALVMNGGWKAIGDGAVQVFGYSDVQNYEVGKVTQLSEIGINLSSKSIL